METLGRANFLQRNLMEGTLHGAMYMNRAYSNDRLAESKFLGVKHNRSFISSVSICCYFDKRRGV